MGNPDRVTTNLGKLSYLTLIIRLLSVLYTYM